MLYRVTGKFRSSNINISGNLSIMKVSNIGSYRIKIERNFSVTLYTALFYLLIEPSGNLSSRIQIIEASFRFRDV